MLLETTDFLLINQCRNLRLIVSEYLEILDNRYGELEEVALGADAGEHEDLRAVDGAGREDDLLAGPHQVDLLVPRELHPVGDLRLRVDQHPRHVTVHRDVQVRPQSRRPQERFRRAAPENNTNRLFQSRVFTRPESPEIYFLRAIRKK